MSKNLSNFELNKKLLPRLKLIGFILLFFSFCSLTYALIATPYLLTEIENPLIKEYEVEPAGIPDFTDPASTTGESARLNLYLVASIFCTIGGTILYLAKKKQKEMANEKS